MGHEQLRHLSWKMCGGSVKRSQGETWKTRHRPPLETATHTPHPHPPPLRSPRGRSHSLCPWNVIFTEEDRGYNPTILQSKKVLSKNSNPTDLSKNTAMVDTEGKETVTLSVQKLQNACLVPALFPGPRTS